MMLVGYAAALCVGAYMVALIERWSVTGRIDPLAPLNAGIALLGRESLVPRQADRSLFEAAPIVLLLAATLAAAVLPLAPGAIAVDLATGALFLHAALAYVMIAALMAGWGANGAYAMIAGWRFLGQLLGYGMLIVMPTAAVAMRAQSLSTLSVVRSQGDLWNVLSQPLGFVVFVVAAMAVAFVPPFDLPVASGEVAGGVSAEYTGVRLAVFRLGRLVLVAALAVTITVFYLGGWLGPVLPGWVWTALKSLLVMAAMFWTGRFVPRMREEHLLAWCWKLGIPLALANIAWVGVTLLAVGA